VFVASSVQVYSLVLGDVLWFSRFVSTFRKKMLSPSAESKVILSQLILEQLWCESVPVIALLSICDPF